MKCVRGRRQSLKLEGKLLDKDEVVVLLFSFAYWARFSGFGHQRVFVTIVSCVCFDHTTETWTDTMFTSVEKCAFCFEVGQNDSNKFLLFYCFLLVALRKFWAAINCFSTKKIFQTEWKLYWQQRLC